MGYYENANGELLVLDKVHRKKSEEFSKYMSCFLTLCNC